MARYLGSLDVGFRWLTALFVVSSGLCLTAVFRRDMRLAAITFMLFPVVLVPVLVENMNPYVQHRSADALIRKLPYLSPDTVMVCYRCYPNGWSFYSRRYVTIITGNDGYELQSNYIRYTLQRTREWPDSMIREGEFPTWLNGIDTPAFVLTKLGDLVKLERVLSDRGASFTKLTDEFAGTLLLPRRMN
jgi:hypothetical protein